ncbi:hypothetical protein BU25DRAFT_422434 [Macroventuria anomochaeta]|uniref:Uncharacterized protein n=1 Tax=Macroventuria anomochaeta TaxID=301207 RepID=A0ACB6RZ43_9PLEO|nr:uncharacterized protein BU25DRAFT_422434 [Macroventuria anomochaeta]KAF2626695.1 hypothetical protein BU25DRAFT_422434 [Macroventuria anomochaeta]
MAAHKLGIRFDDLFKLDPAKLDCGTLSKDLNAANTRLAYAIWACKATARQLDFMDSVAKRYREQAIRQGLSESQAIENEAHAHRRAWSKGISDRAEYLSKRGQALVQTVYSGIAQRDSSISLSLAVTSTKLAETSQDVVIATSRDSAVMGIIVAITVFFRPATFTAVAQPFSSSMLILGPHMLFLVVAVLRCHHRFDRCYSNGYVVPVESERKADRETLRVQKT